jgi:dihydroorotate dehydrogenase
MCAKAYDVGWGGVVFKTIGFFIADEVSPRFDKLGKESTPFVGFKNMEQIAEHPLEDNFRDIARLKRIIPIRSSYRFHHGRERRRMGKSCGFGDGCRGRYAGA